MESHPFNSALVMLNDMYGIEMKQDLFENIALHAWDHIGNKNVKLYVYKEKTVDKKLELPCNVDRIEAVLAWGESLVKATGMRDPGNYNLSRNTIEWIEGLKNVTEELYAAGHYEDYVRNGNTLEFLNDDLNVTVLYWGILADEDGLPSLNFKEVDAITKYCAWIDTQKKAFITKDKATFEMAQLLRQQWQISCDDARTPIHLNQNDMDNILNVQSSWDRKRFGYSYKPIK